MTKRKARAQLSEEIDKSYEEVVAQAQALQVRLAAADKVFEQLHDDLHVADQDLAFANCELEKFKTRVHGRKLVELVDRGLMVPTWHDSEGVEQ